MGTVTILKETTWEPISLIGEMAGICWGSNIKDLDKNYKRGLSCLRCGHMRTAEFPQVYMVFEGYSARVIREFYTHIAGGPTRLQESTRYIEYGDFDYIIPPSIEGQEEKKQVYSQIMENISSGYSILQNMGVPKEDIANSLPLGMKSKIVVRTNLRNLIDMCKVRLCNRAYWEFRQLMQDIISALKNYSNEWREVVEEFFKCKCDICFYCDEGKSCGKRPSKDRIEQLIEYGKKYEEQLKTTIDDGK